MATRKTPATSTVARSNDLDALLKREGIDTSPVRKTKPVKLFGRTWKLYADIAGYQQFSLDEDAFTAASLKDFIDTAVVEEERSAWRKAWVESGMDPESMVTTSMTVIEAMVGKGSKSSSASDTGPSTRDSDPS